MFKVFYKSIDINIESHTPKDITSLENEMNEWESNNPSATITGIAQTTSVNERNDKLETMITVQYNVVEEVPKDAPEKISPKSNNAKPQVAPSTLRKPSSIT